MLAFLRRLIYALSNKILQKNTKEKLIIDFSKIKKSPFDIKPEFSYDANLSNGSFELGLKKSNCIAWVDIPKQEYHDHVIEAKIRLDSFGGYAAAGIVFHMMNDVGYNESFYDESIHENQVYDDAIGESFYGNASYYIALVSDKGYFRLDVVNNNVPSTVIAWSEISNPAHSDFDGTNINLKIITYKSNLIILVNHNWVGEINNNYIKQGRLGFALASYSENPNIRLEELEHSALGKEYTCKAYLEYLSIDTRNKIIEEEY